MQRKWINGVASMAVLAVLGVMALVGLTGREPAEPDPLSDRLRSLLAQQDDGFRVLLPPGDRSLRRIIEAAHALSLLDQLPEQQLSHVLDELESSWSPPLHAYRTDDDQAEYGSDAAGQQRYRYDLLALNVSITEFLQQLRAPTAAKVPRTPDLLRLNEQVDEHPPTHVRIMLARAARLAGERTGSAPAGSCQQAATHLSMNRIDHAGDIILTQPTVHECADELRPLLDEISAMERGLASRILEERRYTYDDLMALDRMRTLSEAAERTELSAESARAAQMVLRHLDDEAREYGPATEIWTIPVLVGLLGEEEEAPLLPHVARRLSTLVDFRGSLATSATVDWYGRTVMAHTMRLSGALAADEAAELVGHPSVDGYDPADPSWVLAYVGLRSRATAHLTLPIDVLADDDSPLVRALYAADAGTCAYAPDRDSFLEVSPPLRVDELSIHQRLSYVLALTLSAGCSADLSGLLPELAAEIDLPAELPDPSMRGSLSGYLVETEAVCLAHGAVTIDPALPATLNSYLQAISTGPVTQPFDFLDLYAALRLLTLHRTGSCDGAWWEGLAGE